MAAGCWAVPAVPTGSRLSSGRPAVTALVPLRNLLGHRALPAKISARVSDDGAIGEEWSYRLQTTRERRNSTAISPR